MTRPFTIDEEIIRRLILRRDSEEQKHAQDRSGRFSFRLWRGIASLGHESSLPRPRGR